MNKWNWLKEYMQKNNISQSEVADALQWQKTRISELLCGKRDFPVNKVFLAAKFFNLDLEELTKYNSGFSKEVPSINGKKNVNKNMIEMADIEILDTANTYGKELAIPPIGKQAISLNVLKQITNAKAKDIKIIITHGDAMQPTINDGDIAWIDISIIKPQFDGLYLFSIKGDLFIKRICFDEFNNSASILSDNKLYPAIKIDNPSKVVVLGKVIAITKMLR